MQEKESVMCIELRQACSAVQMTGLREPGQKEWHPFLSAQLFLGLKCLSQLDTHERFLSACKRKQRLYKALGTIEINKQINKNINSYPSHSEIL